ncbi:hypothetical protein IJ541_06710 [bacterium]|nr:hypothetical protein [bacterium]
MKKFLLTCLVVFFSCLSANASSQVFYGAGGRPSHVSVGGGAYRSINNFGSNALFAPQNVREAGRRQMARKFANAQIQAMTNQGRYGDGGIHSGMVMPKRIEISRFDKNYKISTGKSYTKNGVTYFE